MQAIPGEIDSGSFGQVRISDQGQIVRSKYAKHITKINSAQAFEKSAIGVISPRFWQDETELLFLLCHLQPVSRKIDSAVEFPLATLEQQQVGTYS